MSYISNAMGWILAQLSKLVGYNFAASVLIFTIIVNLLMLPITIKTQKSTAKQAKLKPKLDALKKKYGNDKQKYSQAMSELYSKEGVSMSGGCMPMIIRLFVMLGVYYAVISPLTYVQRIDAGAIYQAKVQVQIVETAKDSSAFDWEDEDVLAALEEKKNDSAVLERAARYDSVDIDFLAKVAYLEDGYWYEEDEAVETAVKAKAKATMQEIDLVKYLTTNDEYYGTVKDVYVEEGGSIDDLDRIEFNLFGIDLTDTPDFSWNFSNFQVIWLIPIASFATAMITSIISMRLQKKTNPDAPSMAAMMLMMPLFSLYIAFKVPGAVGFYWACSNVVSSGLQFTTQALYGPNVVLAKDQANNIIKRAKTEREKIDRVSKEDTTEN
jgi:YidC/Oxa1 family membrane protein insertase